MGEDKNVNRIIAKLRHRSVVGQRKYRVTTDQAGLPNERWLRHLQEELLDAAVYIEAALNNKPE